MLISRRRYNIQLQQATLFGGIVSQPPNPLRTWDEIRAMETQTVEDDSDRLIKQFGLTVKKSKKKVE